MVSVKKITNLKDYPLFDRNEDYFLLLVEDKEISDFDYDRVLIWNVMSPQVDLVKIMPGNELMEEETMRKLCRLSWGTGDSARRNTLFYSDFYDALRGDGLRAFFFIAFKVKILN